MSVDGTDLSKITGDSAKVIAEAAIAAAAPAVVKQSGWFLSRVAAAVLALVLPLVGGVVGCVGIVLLFSCIWYCCVFFV
jgi:hypothetical protein